MLQIVWLAVCLVACAVAAGEGQDQSLRQVLVRIPPTEPQASLKTLRVEPGFRVELVAAEPLVCDPVDVAWDEDGRLFVCELWNYPGEPKAGDPLGRVRLLTSSRRDGNYDQSIIFADNLKWPGGVACYDGGVSPPPTSTLCGAKNCFKAATPPLRRGR